MHSRYTGIGYICVHMYRYMYAYLYICIEDIHIYLLVKLNKKFI